MMKNIVLLITALLLNINLLAQKEKADQLFNDKQWGEASEAYIKYLKEHKKDSSAWYNLGMAHLRQLDYKKAITYFEEAELRNFNITPVAINKSKAYLKLSDTTQALETLKNGAANGLAAYTLLKTDSAFIDLQNNNTFVTVLEKVKLNAYPCLKSKDRRHFDFWLGEWEVYAKGKKVGNNSITMAQGGCAIHENYTTAGNYAGQSINYYDPIDKKWHQHWVGSSGDVYNYLETKREEGLLQFESEFMNGKGEISLSRLTFTANEDGTVRQLFESSTDEGKTWTPAFDGLYKKKNN